MYKVFAVWDEGVKVYTNTFNAINDGAARRMVEEDANNPQHPFGKHTDQFTLFETGQYDETKGLHIPYEAPVKIISLWQLKKDHEGNYMPRSKEVEAKQLSMV